MFDEFRSRIKTYLKNKEFKSLTLELIKWKVIDIYRAKKYGVDVHLFGIRCVTGMYGCGKTMAMTRIAIDLRKKYGDTIYICSNYGLGIQDFEFTDIEQTIEQYDKPIVFLWDEVQNDFPSSDRNFSKDLLKALTLNRKGNGKQFYWASQDHELVHKAIRRLTIEYGIVKTLFGRLTILKWYHDFDYQRLFESTSVDKKVKIHCIRKQKFIQNDYIRSLYNSYSWDNGENLDLAAISNKK